MISCFTLGENSILHNSLFIMISAQPFFFRISDVVILVCLLLFLSVIYVPGVASLMWRLMFAMVNSTNIHVLSIEVFTIHILVLST